MTQIAFSIQVGALRWGTRAVFAGLLAACATTGVSEGTDGNDELGIARFEISESDTLTEVVGVDGQGRELARLDLVHGRFALTGPFVDDYDTAEVIGRKLDVTIDGQPQMVWETAGFDPVLEMPGPEAKKERLNAFLADPHVVAVLDRWQIGFAPADALMGEDVYAYGSFPGTTPTNCTGQTSCGTVQNKTINTCGGGQYAPTSGKRITWAGSGFGGTQYVIAQCCPAASGGGQPWDWFGYKSCPFSGSTSYCGTGSGACKGCAVFDARGYCEVATSPYAGQYLMNECHDSPGTSNTLTVATSGSGGGIVTGGPGLAKWLGIKCGGGFSSCQVTHACDVMKVKLTAAPDTYSTFTSWSGAPGCSTNPVCETFLSSNMTVTATFSSSNQ